MRDQVEKRTVIECCDRLDSLSNEVLDSCGALKERLGPYLIPEGPETAVKHDGVSEDGSLLCRKLMDLEIRLTRVLGELQDVTRRVS